MGSLDEEYKKPLVYERIEGDRDDIDSAKKTVLSLSMRNS